MDLKTAGSISPVKRSKQAARISYNRLSRVYDWLAASERRYIECGLEKLSAQPGETVIEIGPGTGYATLDLALSVAPFGKVLALDLAEKMLARTRRRLEHAALSSHVSLICGDGCRLPLPDRACRAVLMCFTLELFDTDEINEVLQECRRVLQPGGRLAVVSLDKPSGYSRMMGAYEWAHDCFPAWVDCRPIPVQSLLTQAGYRKVSVDGYSMWGLPVVVALGTI